MIHMNGDQWIEYGTSAHPDLTVRGAIRVHASRAAAERAVAKDEEQRRAAVARGEEAGAPLRVVERFVTATAWRRLS